ncbi:MAG: hypothetical protein M3N50_02685, partial [Pseudomonadota bacterium]|nr:hypothetical protein [Pseudomonadota bacterium]
MNRGPVRVLSIVSSLCYGGAEKHTVALLNLLETDAFEPILIYLKPVGDLLPQLNRGRTKVVECLNVNKKVDRAAIRRLSRIIEEYAIEIIVCTNEYPVLYALLA